jgi:predicted DNA-binding transcriptional regulator AlpA
MQMHLMTTDAGSLAANSSPILFTPAQAAIALGLSRSAFWRLHSAGRLPLPVRLGQRCPRWRADELRAWTAAGCPPRDEWERIRRSVHDG